MSDTTILVIDDDDMNLEMLDIMLSDSGCRILKACNGLEAIHVLEENPDIDTMLVDLEMPVMDGFEFIRFVRESPQWLTVPVIVITGSASEVNRTLMMGANEFVSKPFNREELRLRVMNQIRNKKASDADKLNLKNSEARLEQLLQSTEQGIYSVDMAGLCTFINMPGLVKLGFQLEECIGKDIHNLIHHSYPDGLPFPVENCPAHRAIMNGQSYQSTIDVLWKKDGSYFPVDLSSNPLIENGVLSGAVITFTDITERRLIELEQLKLTRAIEQCPVSIVITDTRGIIEFVNPKFTEVTGYSAAETIGKDVMIQQTFGETSPETYNDLWTTISRGNTWEGEYLNRCKDGSLIWERTTISAIQDHSGTIVHYIAVTEDVTERKNILAQLTIAKEQAEQASLAKSSFLATMSHEIRTPMNGVIGMTGMLLETELSPEQKEFTEIVRKSSENLLTIINEILDFSKIESGKLDLEILDFDLRVTLEDAAEMLSLRADDAGIELVCRIDPAVPSHLKGDPGRLRQIIINLVGNAIKFTTKGEVSISAVLRSEQKDAATIHFEVSDTGIGIPESRLAAIFEPFTQVDGSTTRKYGGTGLGLAICKQLTELMNGEFGVKSTEGVGSTFWLTITFEKQDAESLAAIKNLKFSENIDLTKSRILVVDDNATNRRLMVTLLKYWGCRYDIAVDGEDGLAMLYKAVDLEDPFQIALLDQEMPKMDGLELGRRIKQDPRLASTLMVMITSLARRGDVTVMDEIGFSGYLPKPVRQGQLYGVLELILAKSAGQLQDMPNQSRIITKHAVSEYGRQGLRILLAEDNIINQKVAQHMLKSLGYKVDVVADGSEAVQALKMIDYDLVLMDCMMPEMNGFDATTLIRDPDSGVLNHTVPIVAMTANATGEDRKKCLESGMDDYLSKPVRKETLEEMISKWVERDTFASMPHKENAEPAGSPFYDERDMLDRMDSDRSFVKVILNQSLADLPDQLAKLLELCQGDTLSISKQAHLMKGTAAYISAPALAAICSKVQSVAQEGDLKTTLDLIPELEHTVMQTIEAIKKSF
ncbi:MAG: response regulator [Desulfuromonadaceae bacterium]